MSTFNFQSLFKTTTKGLLSKYTKNTLLNREFYNFSLGLQIIFMLVFIGYFGMSMFRSFKKIKNPKFKFEHPDDDSSSSEDEEEQQQEEQVQKNTNDQLIYRFDEEDHEKQRKIQDEEDDFAPEEKEKQKQKQKSQEERNEQDQEYNNQHDENQQAFLQIDHKIMFVQPFFIGHIVCNNLFACDGLSIGMLVATIILFLVFNVKGVCSHIKFLSLLFMIPGILSFLPLFLNDHDLST